jgi:general stress protein YciG
MPEDKQRAISSKGGKAAHIIGAAHQFTTAEARHAGRLGGEAIARNRKHMAEIGRRGGIARGKAALKKAQEAAAKPNLPTLPHPDAMTCEDSPID